MLDLATPIEKIPQVGPRNLPRLRRLGIRTVKDLLWHFPTRYDDFSQITPIVHARPNQTVNIQGRVVKIDTQRSWKKRLAITSAIIEDSSATIRAVWFNRPYLTEGLPPDSLISVAGKVKLDKNGPYLAGPAYERITARTERLGLTHTGRLVPIYPETDGITSKYLRFLIRPLLELTKSIPDSLPVEIAAKYGFLSLEKAVANLHFPSNIKEAEQAKKRVAFDELFLFQLKSIVSRRHLLQLKAPAIPFRAEEAKKLVMSLPFELTGDQRLCAFEILKDLERPYPMNRLLNGDVSSGKTVVALMGANAAAQRGYQIVFLTPTEILAHQHYTTIKSLLSLKPRQLEVGGEQKKIRVGLLTGNEARQWPVDEITEEKISKKLMLSKVARGEVDIVIGTHAVIQKDVQFKNLALVIIDEQHRFGVEQRMKLVKSSGSEPKTCNLVPHLLSMTATPIPRTLALTIYGDLDISLIKEKPKNRKKIITKVVGEKEKKKAYEFIEGEIIKGRQVFVICPRIERPAADIEPAFWQAVPLVQPEPGQRRRMSKTSSTSALGRPAADIALPSGKPSLLSSRNLAKGGGCQRPVQLRHWDVWAEVKAVTEEYEKLSKNIFLHRRIAMLHGKMRPAEKEKVMAGFKNKQYDILVATSVVEVGIDIPNASVMLIENAERFGLAQLHQFRGRVGRAEHQSYCLLISGGNQKFENRRLKALEINDDGFKLAEQDLLLRGPGEFVGTKQSGLPDLAMASLTDLDLIKKARLEAKLLLKADPNLRDYPLLKTQLTQFQKIRHFE